MGYRVDYGPADRAFRGRKTKIPGLSFLFLILLVLLVKLFWAEGSETIRRLLIPGDWPQTIAALEVFAEKLAEGEGLTSSAEVFCRQIMEGAGFGIG